MARLCIPKHAGVATQKIGDRVDTIRGIKPSRRPSPYVPRDQAVRDAGEGPRRNVLICTGALELRLQYGVGRQERRYRAWS